jgi:LCP family protein required for cell wall assembly
VDGREATPAPPRTGPSPRGADPAVPPRERAAGSDRQPTGLADHGSGVPDVSEQAERTRRDERTTTSRSRARRIDETLTRLTAAHAGLPLPGGEEPDAEEPAEEQPARRGRPALGKLLVLGVAVLVFVATTFGWAAKGWLGSAIHDVAALDPASGAIVDAAAQKGTENVLVVATDLGTAPGTATRPGATALRPDTVVVAHIPPGGEPVTVLSIPTDLEINRPPCERFDRAAADYTDETVPAEARTQLATALDMGGPRCATRVVQQLTGIAITKYVGIDLDRIGAAVDAVSGVTVCVARPVLDGVLGPVAPDPGQVELDGRRASDFVRAAAVRGDPPADLGRIERQQQVLAAVLDTVLSTTGLLDVGRLASLRTALGDALLSDGAGLDEILALAQSLRGAPGVTFTSVPTAADADSRGNAVLRDTDAAALFTALRKNTPLPPGAADDAGASTGPEPADVNVQVLNASDKSGLAAKVGDTLKSLGFGVSGSANADQPTPQTVIRFSPDQAAAADLLGRTVPAATAVPDPGATGVLQLVLGRSFDDVVRAPSEPVALRSAPGSDPTQPPTASCT